MAVLRCTARGKDRMVGASAKETAGPGPPEAVPNQPAAGAPPSSYPEGRSGKARKAERGQKARVRHGSQWIAHSHVQGDAGLGASGREVQVRHDGIVARLPHATRPGTLCGGKAVMLRPQGGDRNAYYRWRPDRPSCCRSRIMKHFRLGREDDSPHVRQSLRLNIWRRSEAGLRCPGDQSGGSSDRRGYRRWEGSGTVWLVLRIAKFQTRHAGGTVFRIIQAENLSAYFYTSMDLGR